MRMVPYYPNQAIVSGTSLIPLGKLSMKHVRYIDCQKRITRISIALTLMESI